jgi:ABC-2 type transport system permease protein
MNPAPAAAPWSPVRTYTLEARYEFLKLLRMPGYALPSIAFPAMFYLLFGVLFGGRSFGGASMATYLLATYGAFGVIGAALFAFGVAVAVERGQGWMMLKRASPMPPMAFFVAKLFMCAMFALVIVLVLAAIGFGLGGVELPPRTWLGLGATLVAGAMPFCAIGLGLGYLLGPNSAVPVVNLLFLTI